jgi:hypothetical protein
LAQEVDKTVTERTIKNLLNEMGLQRWKQRGRLALKPQHAAKRFAWARTYAHFISEDWVKVRWTDECSVERGRGIGARWTFTRPSEQLERKDVHSRPCGKGVSQMFWAGFGTNMRTELIELNGNPIAKKKGVTGVIIRQLYEEQIFQLISSGDILMQDNAPYINHRWWIVY